jgi:iron-sulfur cluster assembly accessory protein
MITITQAAAEKVQEILKSEGKEGQALRVVIQGGGCSGFQYGLTFAEEAGDMDEVLDQHGIQVVIDQFSLPYVDGASIDYVEDVMGGGFKISNPNVTGTCGCGKSFSA